MEDFQGKLLFLICESVTAAFQETGYRGVWRDWIQCGIEACGHQARDYGILMKISIAYMPGQIAYDTYYSSNGVVPARGWGVMSFWGNERDTHTHRLQLI